VKAEPGTCRQPIEHLHKVGSVFRDGAIIIRRGGGEK